MQGDENTDPIAPKRGMRARTALISNAVCKLAVVSGLFLCATRAESALLSGCYARRYRTNTCAAYARRQTPVRA